MDTSGAVYLDFEWSQEVPSQDCWDALLDDVDCSSMDSPICHNACREVSKNPLDPRSIIVPVGVIRSPQPDLGEVFLVCLQRNRGRFGTSVHFYDDRCVCPIVTLDEDLDHVSVVVVVGVPRGSKLYAFESPAPSWRLRLC